MLVTDGNRIDMTLIPIEEKENTAGDKLIQILMDKDQAFPIFLLPPTRISG